MERLAHRGEEIPAIDEAGRELCSSVAQRRRALCSRRAQHSVVRLADTIGPNAAPIHAAGDSGHNNRQRGRARN